MVCLIYAEDVKIQTVQILWVFELLRHYGINDVIMNQVHRVEILAMFSGYEAQCFQKVLMDIIY